MRSLYLIPTALLAAVLAGACGDNATDGPARSAAPTADSTAFVNVSVIPMDREQVLRGQTVLVEKGKIVSVQPSDDDTPPVAATVIDASDQYLIPGFADLHVHIGEPWGPRGKNIAELNDEVLAAGLADEMFLYVANGVTLVRNMDGRPFHLQLRQRIKDGAIVGPEIITAGPIVHGPNYGYEDAPGAWGETEQDGLSIVDEQIGAGYDFIKVYNAVSPAAYEAIHAAARQRSVQVVGHVPFDVGIWGALEQGQSSISHLRGYDFDPEAPPQDPQSVERFMYWNTLSEEKMWEYAEATAKTDVYNVPTTALDAGLVTGAAREALTTRAEMDYISPALRSYMRERTIFDDEVIEMMRSTLPAYTKMIGIMHQAGAGLLAGTDAPVFYTLPGFSIHDELSNFNDAGLSEYEALKTATVAPARFFGRDGEMGQVAAGFNADLILLAGNPLDDIDHTRDIEGVMVNGKWFDRQAIDQELERIADRNSRP